MSPHVLAYLRLLRLPTVFTALADIFLGFLLTHPTLTGDAAAAQNRLLTLLLLCLASAGLYLSGMVFNDYFDRLMDAQERPERPIPSGQVSEQIAWKLGAGLMLTGVMAAAGVGLPSLCVAIALSVLILAYDSGLKKTPLGPIAMGGCRFGNVMLGASDVASMPDLFAPQPLLIAGGLGVYIAGVTLFAKQEASVSRRVPLLAAAAIINAGVLGLAALVNRQVLDDNRTRALAILAMILFTIDRRLVSAMTQPEPAQVQLAIKTLLLSLVVIDGTLVYAFNGRPEMAMLTVALILPALVLSRLIAMT
jgi:4-hydroxybenzoate polyprenyltransferase